MARKIITGDKELEATLKHLADKSADAVARSAVGGALAVLKRNIKKAAPVGPTGNLKASVGSRFDKAARKNRNTVTAKAGLNVGKKTKRKKVNGPHAHLVALGTKPRFRKTLGGKFAGIKNPTNDQLSTGTMPSNAFVRDATGRSVSQMRTASVKRATKALEREAIKAASRTRSN